MRKSFLVIFSIVLLSTLIGSCKKEDQGELDREIIEAYVLEHELNGQFNESGLYYVIEEPGGDAHPSVYSEVTVYYKGYFLDGTVFDSNIGGDKLTTPLYNLIRGWQQGLQLIGKEGKITMVIPSGLAYGYNGSGSIAPNTVIAFDVELVSFRNFD